MRVSEIMSSDVYSVTTDVPLTAAAALMREQSIGMVPVTQNRQLVGVVTDRDIVVRGLADARNPDTTPIKDIMSSQIVYCRDGDDADAAALQMKESQIRRLPVINEAGQLIGILALGDLASQSDTIRPAAIALSGVSQERATPK
jgi:CBS-domain-containing membrane protein